MGKPLSPHKDGRISHSIPELSREMLSWPEQRFQRRSLGELYSHGVRGNQWRRSHCIPFARQVLSVAPRVENIVWQISSNTSSFLQMGSLLIVKEILTPHSLYENSSLADGALCLLKISEGILGFSRSLCWKVGTGGTTRDEIERHEF